MATITGLTADRMKEIEDAAIVTAEVIDGDLILTRHDGSTFNAGYIGGGGGGGGVTAHSELTGLTEGNDHTQYLMPPTAEVYSDGDNITGEPRIAVLTTAGMYYMPEVPAAEYYGKPWVISNISGASVTLNCDDSGLLYSGFMNEILIPDSKVVTLRALTIPTIGGQWSVETIHPIAFVGPTITAHDVLAGTGVTVELSEDGDQVTVSADSANDPRLSQPTMLFSSGRYTSPSSSSSGNGTTGNNVLYYTPIYFPRELTFDRVAIIHGSGGAGSTGEGSVYRLGIYDSLDDAPNDLLVEFGTVDLHSAHGIKDITILETFSPGLYWLAGVGQYTSGSPEVSLVNYLTIPVAQPGLSPGSSSTYYTSSVTGALPASATIDGANYGPAIIYLRTL
jgi:hypothetical protein